ncbi:uncharacterized protein LOC125501123 [Athalia rosae]|uniref:uncharacterized protein LOC125501123 n=1 Tax=Athalia rosae TaxID=37344 RepID=UPI0020340847|nr:uncharacterized protein LOC125501123 [Athalia rosae]
MRADVGSSEVGNATRTKMRVGDLRVSLAVHQSQLLPGCSSESFDVARIWIIQSEAFVIALSQCHLKLFWILKFWDEFDVFWKRFKPVRKCFYFLLEIRLQMNICTMRYREQKCSQAFGQLHFEINLKKMKESKTVFFTVIIVIVVLFSFLTNFICKM